MPQRISRPVFIVDVCPAVRAKGYGYHLSCAPYIEVRMDVVHEDVYAVLLSWVGWLAILEVTASMGFAQVPDGFTARDFL